MTAAAAPKAAALTRASEGPLRDVIAFVEVYSDAGALDMSSVMAAQLASLGAAIATRPSDKRITHVVFQDGRQKTLESARALGATIKLVTPSWVYQCADANALVPEAAYQVTGDVATKKKVFDF
jgi:hypothetical protein